MTAAVMCYKDCIPNEKKYYFYTSMVIVVVIYTGSCLQMPSKAVNNTYNIVSFLSLEMGVLELE